MKSERLKISILLVITLFFGGYLSVYLGKDLWWDLAFYHYYTPYAFLHGRGNLDYWPKSYIHLYINPTLDLLTYFLIHYLKPKLSVFLLGAIHSINFWLLFLIARKFLHRSYWAFILAAIGMYNPLLFEEIGSFTNDYFVSISVLIFILLQIQLLQFYTNTKQLKGWKVFLSGLILGLGVGLKLTIGLFFIGAALTVIIMPFNINNRLKWLIFFSSGVLLGTLVFSGHWFWLMWLKHHNPFFPFWNGIFHSPDFPSINWHDNRYMPQGWLEKVFFPFYFSFDGRAAENSFKDFRFAIIYILFVIAGIQWTWKKIQNQKISIDLATVWLFAFFIFSYIIWQETFSIFRYLATLEMLAPLIIFLLLQKIIQNKFMQFASQFIIFYLLIFTLKPINPVRAPWYDGDYFNIKLPANIEQHPHATVLVAFPAFTLNSKPKYVDINPSPQMYLIPFFPKEWRFIGIPILFDQLAADQADMNVIRHLIHISKDNLFLLTTDRDMAFLYRLVKDFGLIQNGGCQEISSDRQKMSSKYVLLCAVKKNY